MRINKNRYLIILLALIMLVNISSFVIANSSLDINYTQDGNQATISVTGERNRPVSITIKDESRYFYMDQDVTNDYGQASFKTNLDKGKSYDCKVNIDGELVNKTIIMKEDQDPGTKPDPEDKNIASLYIKGYNGVILNKSNIEINKGETVLNLTTRILDENHIGYSSSGGYVSSINGQKEFDKGKDSGWMFSVNGKYPDVGAGVVKVNRGDSINWLYTYNLGDDIGAPSGGGGLKKDDNKINNSTIDEALKAIGDKKTSESNIGKAIDNIVKNFGSKKTNLKAEEIKEILEDSSKITEVLLMGLDRAKTEELAINIGSNAIKITKSLEKVLEDKKDSDTIEKLSGISRGNMGIALAAINKIKDKDQINTIVDDILETSTKIESKLSAINSNPNKNAEKSIGIKLIEDKNNNWKNVLPYQLLKKAMEKNIDKIKISCEFISLEIAPNFLGIDINDDINLNLESKNGISTIELKQGNKILRKLEKPIKVTLPYDENIVNKNNITVELIEADGRKEIMGGIYDETTKSVKFTTNELGKFIIKENNISFNDLGSHTWAEEAINSMAAKGIINGRSEDNFDPSSNITRAEFSTLISRTLKLNESLDKTLPFEDIREDAWYYKSILAVYGDGLVNGISESSFDPEGNITREEMTKIIGQVLEKKSYKKQNKNNLSQFKDGDNIEKWAEDGIAIAVHNKIINGNNGEFMPKADATRGETATILYRLYGLIME